MTPFASRPFVAVLALAVLFILPAYGDPPSQPEASDTAANSPASAPSRDYLVGWYTMLPRDRRTNKVLPGPGTLIPVLKIDGAYYSVCRGVEIPFKECPEGLEWDATPSSMVGTKIGLDKESGTVYLAVVDANVQDDNYEPGRKQPLAKIDKPADLLDPAAPAPRTNDDFVGWYQPALFPYSRYQVRKEGDKYIAVMQRARLDGLAGSTQPGSQTARETIWEAVDKPAEITPLPDRLGFVFGSGKKAMHLTYNKALKRFEFEMPAPGAPPLRMPLARIPAPPAPHLDAVPLLKARIGIPSWH